MKLGLLRLYMISQTVNRGYDTYDSAVVAADDEEAAKKICPDHSYVWRDEGGWCFVYADGRIIPEGTCHSWAMPTDVKVVPIGAAVEGTEEGVIVASFNAG